MFRTSHALVISKTDLLPHVPFSIEAAAADARQINPALAVLTVSSLCGEGIERWCQYLEDERRQLLAQGFADPALQGDAERVR